MGYMWGSGGHFGELGLAAQQQWLRESLQSNVHHHHLHSPPPEAPGYICLTGLGSGMYYDCIATKEAQDMQYPSHLAHSPCQNQNQKVLPRLHQIRKP